LYDLGNFTTSIGITKCPLAQLQLIGWMTRTYRAGVIL
jgi:hypothetical protein